MNAIFLPLALVFSALALWMPEWFIPTKPAIPYLLGLIMFGMGITLTMGDFLGVIKRWRLVVIGVLAQYTMMPLLALGMTLALGLPKEVVAGFVLLGACPGGTASNVVTYLAKGNVALSVSMTLVSTLLAPVLTPWITWLLASHKVAIDAVSMMQTILWIVALPLAGGLIIRLVASKLVLRTLKWLPLFSMVLIAWVIAIVMALNRERILEFPQWILLAVVLHNLLGLAIGYGIARYFTSNQSDCRTIAIEVGMQNSGLAVALAAKYLPAAAALPAALFSLWHNLSGAAFASAFGRRQS